MPGPLTPALVERLGAAFSASRRATPFQSPEWLKSLYLRHAQGQPLPLALDHGFAPLIRERKGPWKTLRLAGADYEDIVCADGDESAAVGELLFALAEDSSWTIANFRALRPDSALLQGLSTNITGAFKSRLTPHREHRYVQLPNSWSEYEDQLGKKLAYKLRAAAGRRDKAFESHELRVATEQTLQADLQALFELHEIRWTARGESGVFPDEEAKTKFREASHALLQAGRLRLYTLWLDGKPASALYCLADRRALYYYIGGIDVAHQKHHPGKVLIARAIQDAIEDGLLEFDFLSGGEAYKDDWANATRPVFRLTIGRGALGRLAVGLVGPIDGRLRARKTARERRKAEAWASNRTGKIDE